MYSLAIIPMFVKLEVFMETRTYKSGILNDKCRIDWSWKMRAHAARVIAGVCNLIVREYPLSAGRPEVSC